MGLSDGPVQTAKARNHTNGLVRPWKRPRLLDACDVKGAHTGELLGMLDVQLRQCGRHQRGDNVSSASRLRRSGHSERAACKKIFARSFSNLKSTISSRARTSNTTCREEISTMPDARSSLELQRSCRVSSPTGTARRHTAEITDMAREKNAQRIRESVKRAQHRRTSD